MTVEGYVAATAYPPHFPRAFAPAWIDHVLRRAGRQPRRGARGAFRYLDLGCGNGLQLIALAAALPEGRFVGTDANGAAMDRAAVIAEAVGVGNVAFRQETFAETLARAGTGQAGFDYMAALGVLSWVSPENRARAIDIAGALLAPGGAAAFGYNTLPGRGPEILLQRIVLEAARVAGEDQPAAVARALDQAADLAAAGALGLRAPRVAQALEARRRMDPDFLPHEYLSEHWAPLDAAEIVRMAEAAGLSYAGALTLLENRPDYLLRKAERAIIDAAPDAGARARLIDLCIDQSFRRDLYVKADGPAGLPETASADGWLAARVEAENAAYVLETRAGRLRFGTATARAIMDGLWAGPARLADMALPGGPAAARDAADALLAADMIEPVEAPGDHNGARFNAWLRERAAMDAPTLPVQVGRHGVRPLALSTLARLTATDAAAARLPPRLGLDDM